MTKNKWPPCGTSPRRSSPSSSPLMAMAQTSADRASWFPGFFSHQPNFSCCAQPAQIPSTIEPSTNCRGNSLPGFQTVSSVVRKKWGMGMISFFTGLLKRESSICVICRKTMNSLRQRPSVDPSSSTKHRLQMRHLLSSVLPRFCASGRNAPWISQTPRPQNSGCRSPLRR